MHFSASTTLSKLAVNISQLIGVAVLVVCKRRQDFQIAHTKRTTKMYCINILLSVMITNQMKKNYNKRNISKSNKNKNKYCENILQFMIAVFYFNIF